MERQNKLSIKMWDTASTIANTADTTSASTNSTATSNINTISNFAVTTTTASIVAVTTTTANIVSVTTSTASNTRTMVSIPVTTDNPRRGRGFIPGHGHFRNLGGVRGYTFREIENKMGGSSNQMLLSHVLQHWKKDVQKYYNPPLPGKRRRNKRGGQNSQGQRGLGGRGRRGGRGGQGGTGGMTI